ncbi:putative F-box protein At5g62660 [Cornus florida]|uniref:putative F-box protein At5g62660 n=1 Tax=Cornus florida TaxID=4283 RepID=UPI00289B03DF|nr:putative F-box protein At5g62660 [Cornus florida]
MKRGKRDESAPLPFLPYDLIFNILSWLPVKSILRFKCVRKSLLTLSTNPDFVKKHLSRSQNRKLIVSCKSRASYPRLLVMPTCGTDDHRPIHNIGIRGINAKIVGSCDGLVLYATQVPDRLYLLNPSTEKLNTLPVLSSRIEHIHSSFSYGFGFDASIDDYKVVATSAFFDRDS